MKSKLIYTIVAFVFATQTIVAQYKISGTIKDEKSKEVLKGAAIYISDLKTGATTDKAGKYELENIILNYSQVC